MQRIITRHFGDTMVADRKLICETHPHLDFDLQRIIGKLVWSDWLTLGECCSKIDHICGVPLAPHVAEQLHRLSLIRGTQATTAIEGNTLSEEQVQGIHDGSLKLPPSQAYMQREVENIIVAHNRILQGLGQPENLSVDFIRDLNRQVLKDLGGLLEDHVVPGEFSTKPHGVANYRAPRPEFLEALSVRFVETFGQRHEAEMASNIIRAVLAHLYFVWIHPFGDGNGRTGRLIEHYILVHSGVPTPAAHLLVHHYNKTRSLYQAELRKASDTGEALGFIRYALGGFADGLRSHIEVIQQHQLDVAWRDYIHERCPHKTETDKRRIDLMLTLPVEWINRRDIPLLSARMGAHYGLGTGARSKAMTRDINKLRELKLVETSGRNRVRARREIMLACPRPRTYTS
ncbi:MAG: Fic family protein [Planctomycetes bacterium]|nr:Fic family protein [Planctomycetota bacterium]